MKMTWPVGITLLLLLFMSGTMIMVYIAVNQDFSLVSKSYYEDSLEYDVLKTKQENRMRDQAEIAYLVSVDQKSLTVTFNNQLNAASGTISFYNPAEPKEDFSVEIKPNNGVQIIDLSDKPRGLWKMKVDWKQNETSYFQENAFKLN